MLERLLARAGWTPENLSDQLNELAVSLSLRARVNRRTPRRWVYVEAGRPAPRVPREPWPALVCHVLHERLGEPVTLDCLGWTATGPLLYVPADDGLDQPWTPAGALAALACVVDADCMERRHFVALTGLTLTAVAHQWLFDPARVAASVQGKRVNHALVNDLERVVDARRRMDDTIGGGSLLPAVREDLRLVVAMLSNAAYTEEVGKRLHAVAAELGRLAGWLASDSEQPALAQRYFRAAVRAAHVSGDRAVGGNILGFTGVQVTQSNRPGDAVILAESALRAERELTPAVAGGSPRLTHRATSANRCWRWVNRVKLSRTCAGRSACSTPTSVATGRSGSASWPPLRLGMGSVEHACATATEAAVIIRRLHTPHGQRKLADFRAAAPYARTAAVREFDVKYRDLLSAPLT